jgi:hypothetical protein
MKECAFVLLFIGKCRRLNQMATASSKLVTRECSLMRTGDWSSQTGNLNKMMPSDYISEDQEDREELENVRNWTSNRYNQKMKNVGVNMVYKMPGSIKMPLHFK